MPQTTYYLYHGVTIPEEFQDAVDSFIRNEPKPGRRVEKLKGHKSIFSIRLNQKARLLFTYFQDRILILGVLPNHEYPNSFNRWKQLIEANIIECEMDEFENTAQGAPRAVLPDPRPVHPFHGGLVLLSEEQKSVLEGQGQPPCLFIGHAGTGKTLAAMRLLASLVLLGYQPEKPIVFLCESPRLARTMAEQFFNEFGPLENFRFLSYDEWISEVSSCAPVLGFEHFKNWLNTSCKRLKQDLDKNKISAKQLYQELRILSGLKIKEDYLTLGKKQSSIPKDNPKLRHQILEAYFAYQRCLDEAQEKNQEINPHFYEAPIEGIFGHVVVDEAQDLSGVQIRNLFKAALGRITAFMDTYQSLLDQLSKQDLFCMLAREFGLTLTIQYLTRPYRCAPLIERVLDCIRKATCIATGGQREKRAQSMAVEPAQDNGSVEIYTPSDFHASEFYKNTDFSQYADIAIITSKAHLEEAKALFNTPFVFTAEQIKGHQFRWIIAYRCMDKAFSRTLDGILKDASRKYSSQNRPKDGHSYPQYGPPLHELLVAFSRAVETLMIVEDDNQLIQVIKTRLAQEQHAGLPNQVAEFSEPKQVSSQEDWLNAAKNLLKEAGPSLQVQEALKKAGMHSKTEINAFMARHASTSAESEKTVSGVLQNVGAEGSSSGSLAFENTVPQHKNSTKSKKKKSAKRGKRGKSGKKAQNNQHHIQMVQQELVEKPKELSRQERRKQERQQKRARQRKIPEQQPENNINFANALSLRDLSYGAHQSHAIPCETIAPGADAETIMQELKRDGHSDLFVKMAHNKEHFQLTTFVRFKQLLLDVVSQEVWLEQLNALQEDGKTVIEYFFDSPPKRNHTPHDLPCGMTFLAKLFEVYPDLLKKIPSSVWLNGLDVMQQRQTMTRVHFFMRCLMWTEQGTAYLFDLFEKNPNVFENFSLGLWKRPNRLGEPELLSAVTNFERLSVFKVGKQLLQKLLEQDRRRVNEIEIKDWLALAVKPPLLWRLACDKEGLDLLNVLINQQSEVIKHMPFKVWRLSEIRLENEARAVVKHSAVYHFLKTEYGRHTLCRLSEMNDTLFTKSESGFWKLPAYYLDDQCPLNFLCTVGDKDVLEWLGRSHPKLLEQEKENIPPEPRLDSSGSARYGLFRPHEEPPKQSKFLPDSSLEPDPAFKASCLRI